MKRRAILTIDDSPSIHMQARVEFLARQGIPAVWFCRGDYLEERPEAAIAAIRAGSVLGNHSWDHQYFSKLSLDEARDQIERTDALLDQVYARAGVARPARWFRFPYEDRVGSPEHHAALQAMLRARGFTLPAIEGVRDRAYLEKAATGDVSWFWTYDTQDWTIPAEGAAGAAEALAKVLARMDIDDPAVSCGLEQPEGTEIVVMHDHGHTGRLWESVVQGLIDKGFEFVVPSAA